MRNPVLNPWLKEGRGVTTVGIETLYDDWRAECGFLPLGLERPDYEALDEAASEIADWNLHMLAQVVDEIENDGSLSAYGPNAKEDLLDWLIEHRRIARGEDRPSIL